MRHLPRWSDIAEVYSRGFHHWIDHNGSSWEKDCVLDKCYPKFKVASLEESINRYIELYISNLKTLQRKYPKNIKPKNIQVEERHESEKPQKQVWPANVSTC